MTDQVLTDAEAATLNADLAAALHRSRVAALAGDGRGATAVPTPDALVDELRSAGLPEEAVLLSGGGATRIRVDEKLTEQPWPPLGMLAAADLTWLVQDGPSGPRLLRLS